MPKTVPGFSISGVNSNVFAVVKFPFSAGVWPSLAAVLLTDCSNIRYQDARSNRFGSLPEPPTAKQQPQLNMGSRHSRTEISTNFPFAVVRRHHSIPRQIAGRLTFKLAAISDFIKQNQVEGVLSAQGDLRFDHLQVDGTVRANGSQLKYREMNLRIACPGTPF